MAKVLKLIIEIDCLLGSGLELGSCKIISKVDYFEFAGEDGEDGAQVDVGEGDLGADGAGEEDFLVFEVVKLNSVVQGEVGEVE
jgi:hypothetical protein